MCKKNLVFTPFVLICIFIFSCRTQNNKNQTKRMEQTRNMLLGKLSVHADWLRLVFLHLPCDVIFQSCILVNHRFHQVIDQKYDFLFQKTVDNSQLKKYFTLAEKETSMYEKKWIEYAEKHVGLWIGDYIQSLCSFAENHVLATKCRYVTNSNQTFMETVSDPFRFTITFTNLKKEKQYTTFAQRTFRGKNNLLNQNQKWWIMKCNASTMGLETLLDVDLKTLVDQIEKWVQDSNDHCVLFNFLPPQYPILAQLSDVAKNNKSLTYHVYCDDNNNYRRMTPFPIPVFRARTFVSSVVFPRRTKETWTNGLVK